MKETIKELNEITTYLSSIKKKIEEQIIQEGVYDPGVLKCVFTAGGPGSGKSFVANSLFGLDKANVSYTGLKSINSDSVFERELRNNGIDPKDLAKIEKENPDLFADITSNPNGIRGKAKNIVKKIQSLYEAGRLGLIIDGTGRDYSKISEQRERAINLGYDCYMVFVNTSLESALLNNKKRDRTLPDDLVQRYWRDCQENMGRFQSLFGSKYFRIVDNTNRVPVANEIKKSIAGFINSPISNPIGKKWIEQQLRLKNAGVI